MSLSKSQLQIFKEKNRGPGGDVDDNDDDGIIRKADIIVKGIAQESPPFINTCQTNSFLTALRFSFFYNSGNFIKNFRHRRPGPKKIEDAIRVIGTLSKEIEVDPSLIKMAWNTISKVSPENGVFNFSGSEQGRVFEHLAEMSEFGLRMRCSCPRDYDDDTRFRSLSRIMCRRPEDLDDWSHGTPKHFALRKCKTCDQNFEVRLDIPDTTWMIVLGLRHLNLRDLAKIPTEVKTVSKPTENEDDNEEIRWRLAYISAVQPIPSNPDADHLISLQFLHREGKEVLRVYYNSTDGYVIQDTPSEKKMNHGHLLKKKVNDVLLRTAVIPAGKEIYKKPEHAVYFRIR